MENTKGSPVVIDVYFKNLEHFFVEARFSYNNKAFACMKRMGFKLSKKIQGTKFFKYYSGEDAQARVEEMIEEIKTISASYRIRMLKVIHEDEHYDGVKHTKAAWMV